MKVLKQMAKLILQNPSITVRELANTLGYSEEKSIYYWLEKANFFGIKQFKQAVLTGEFPVDESAFAIANSQVDFVSESGSPPPRLPLMKGFGPQGNPIFATPTISVFGGDGLSQNAFAFVLEVKQYMPYFMPSDLVIVDPAIPLEDGAWVLYWRPGAPPEIRRYYRVANTTLLLHPVRCQDVIRIEADTPHSLRRVARIIRDL
ncbi:MAG TPA: hypothetical protein GXZ96_02470 [Firmicutes bacterium]|jgi:hypothetical protein|nr:hypothetical protein [Bacillota bacterium]